MGVEVAVVTGSSLVGAIAILARGPIVGVGAASSNNGFRSCCPEFCVAGAGGF